MLHSVPNAFGSRLAITVPKIVAFSIVVGTHSYINRFSFPSYIIFRYYSVADQTLNINAGGPYSVASFSPFMQTFLNKRNTLLTVAYTSKTHRF